MCSGLNSNFRFEYRGRDIDWPHDVRFRGVKRRLDCKMSADDPKRTQETLVLEFFQSARVNSEYKP